MLWNCTVTAEFHFHFKLTPINIQDISVVCLNLFKWGKYSFHCSIWIEKDINHFTSGTKLREQRFKGECYIIAWWRTRDRSDLCVFTFKIPCVVLRLHEESVLSHTVRMSFTKVQTWVLRLLIFLNLIDI